VEHGDRSPERVFFFVNSAYLCSHLVSPYRVVQILSLNIHLSVDFCVYLAYEKCNDQCGRVIHSAALIRGNTTRITVVEMCNPGVPEGPMDLT
jgi:hypothetical protein